MAVCVSQGSMGLHNQQYHLITTDNKHLQGVGLGSFTAKQLWEKLAYNKVLSVGAAPGPVVPPSATSMSRQDLWNTIMQAGSQRPQVDTEFNVAWFLRWDSNKKKMKYSKVLLSAAGAAGDAHPYGGMYPSILDSIKWNYSVVTGQGTDISWARPKEFLIDVKTSQNGAITWKARMHITYQPGCTIEIEPTFRLCLFDGPLKRTERTLMNRGIDIAMVPHHASSTPDKPVTYSPARGGEAKSDGGGGSQAGFSTMPVEEGGDRNARNVQTGELKVTHNKNTGQFEAGTTQIMARLITDVSAVIVRPINTDGIHTSEPEAFFDTSMESYTGDNSRGKAVPMSIHNGNPHQFGPNWVDPICEGNRKHIIDVINRSPESFSAGDLVMCTNIDGRWYIQSFGKVGNKYFKISRWSFQHIITDSANFFKDDLYGSKPETHTRTLSSENYEENFRYMFFYDLANQPPGGLIGVGGVTQASLVAMAAANIDLTPAVGGGSVGATMDINKMGAAAGAWQMTSFDLVGTHLGGKNPNGNLIGRTNIDYDSVGEAQGSDELGARFLYPFWGATFTDGYDAGRLKDMRKSPPTMSARPQLGGGNEFLTGGTLSLFDTSQDVQTYGGMFAGYDAATPPNYTVTQSNDGKQIPADIALNSSPAGENGRPLENFTWLKLHGSASRFTSLPTNLQLYFSRADEAGNQVYGKGDDGSLNGEQIRYNWLSTGDKWTDSTYDLAPTTPSHITFIPLTAECVAMEDGFQHGSRQNHIWWEDARRNLGTATRPAPPAGAFLDSSWWTRNRTGLVIFDSSCPNSAELTTFASSGPNHVYPKDPAATAPGVSAGFDGIPYDWHVASAKYDGGCMLVEAKNLNATIDMDWWNDPGGGGYVADCVGIVAAKCQIQAKGEAVELATHQRIGLPIFGTVSGGADRFTILPIGNMPAWGGAVYTFENSTPQWGNSSDNYNTFGTTALHAKMYQQWPEEQTIYDPRYFAVMHFNEGQIGEPVTTKKDDDGVTIDVQTYSVDMRVPTYKGLGIVPAGLVAYRKAGTPIVAGVGDTSGGFDELAAFSKWRVNPIRRGMLLPLKYLRRTIGVRPGLGGSAIKIKEAGSGYVTGDRFISLGGSGHGATGKIEAVNGEVSAITFDEEEGIQKLGQDYEPGDFALYSGNNLEDDGSVTIAIESDNGSGAVIVCLAGLVYDAIKEDKGPIKQGGTAQLSLGSANGDGNKKGRTIGNKVSSIEISSPSQHGIYDLFLYFHNDIGHTMANGSTYAPMWQQYISLEVGIQ